MKKIIVGLIITAVMILSASVTVHSGCGCEDEGPWPWGRRSIPIEVCEED